MATNTNTRSSDTRTGGQTGKRAARSGTLLWAALALGVGALGAESATAAPDLVIIEQDSAIRFESCERNQPLATGFIAIKNVGDSRARLPLGMLSRFSRTLVAVYVPEHLDMIDASSERSVLDARDQESVQISLGRGVQKRGRFPGSGGIVTDLDNAETIFGGSGGGAADSSGGQRYTGRPGSATLNRDSIVMVDMLTGVQRQEIQRALRDLGYYNGSIDGVMGTAFDRAVRDFQRFNGGGDGMMTVAQMEALSGQTGRTLAIDAVAPAPNTNTGFGSGSLPRQALNRAASTGSSRVEVTLYAVVDPYNLVEESDETNNLVRFTGYIDCR